METAASACFVLLASEVAEVAQVVRFQTGGEVAAAVSAGEWCRWRISEAGTHVCWLFSRMNIWVQEPSSLSWHFMVWFLAMVLCYTGTSSVSVGASLEGLPYYCGLERWIEGAAHGGSFSADVDVAELLLQQRRCVMETVSGRLNTAETLIFPAFNPNRKLAPAVWEGRRRQLVDVNSTAVAEDVAALLAFKAALLGSDGAPKVLANWTVTGSNSNVDDHCRTWAGVDCNGALRVVALNLPLSGLIGAIPPVIGNLTELSYLNLSSNSLSGAIPLQIMQCRKLVSVDLRKNTLRGGIPAEIAELSQLEQLVLSDNDLVGDLAPLALTRLKQLQVLDLQNNTFSGRIPSELALLHNLTWLNLAGNQLNGSIPPELGFLGSLEVLDLRSNSLSGEIPRDLRNLTSLTQLYLTGNNLTGQVHSEFSALVRLRVMHLGDNQLSGKIPSQVGKLRNLQDLRLNQNSLSGRIPRELRNCTRLINLYLGDNNLTGRFPSELGGLTQLQVLSVGNNHLSGEIPESLGNCSSLVQLNLTFNDFTGAIPMMSLGNLPNLTFLFLNNNHLTGSITPGRFKSVIVSALSYNNLSGSIPDSVGEWTNIQLLDLSANNLTGEIPRSLANLSQLITLDLASNHLVGDVGSIMSIFKGCKLFGVFSLQRNQISGSLDSLNFNNFPYLHFFSASYNKITGTLPSSLGNTPLFLEILDLSHNYLSGSLPQSINSTNLPYLRIFSLAVNNFTGPIPPWIGYMKTLHILQVSENHFSGPIPEEISHMEGLKTLAPGIPFLSSFKPTKLLDLNLRGQDASYDYTALDFVSHLDFSYNALSGSIPPGLSQLVALKYLYLSNNYLEGEIPTGFGSLQILEVMELSHNNLTGVIPSDLATIPSLNYFNVSYNNLEGPIPAGGQFDTFTNPLFYLPGNNGLCGNIIKRKCNVTSSLQGSDDGDQIGEWIHDNISLEGFSLGFGVALLSMGCTVAFWSPAKQLVFGKKSDKFAFTISSDGLLQARSELLRR